MQKGYIYQANGAWHVRYRVDGEQISRKLADYNDQYRTKRSVRPLAGEIIDPLNQGREVDGPMTLQRYAETVYFPNIKPKKSPSTLQGLFQPVLQADSADVSVDSDFRRVRPPTFSASCTASTDKRTRGTFPPSFLNINSVLSAVFTHARRSGTFQGPNPTDGVEIQKAREPRRPTSTRWRKLRRLRTPWTVWQPAATPLRCLRRYRWGEKIFPLATAFSSS
jgi:hypothetical protein